MSGPAKPPRAGQAVAGAKSGNELAQVGPAAESTPMTSPSMSNRSPPELPWLMAASV